MNLEKLILSAKELKNPSEPATKEFFSYIDTLAEELNRTMLSRLDIEKLIGPVNFQMMENNSRNFLRFMGSIFYNPDAGVLSETAVWAFRTYRSHGFQIAYWPANIDTTIQIMKKDLPEPVFDEIYPFFEWLIIHIPAFTELSETDGGSNDPHGLH